MKAGLDMLEKVVFVSRDNVLANQSHEKLLNMSRDNTIANEALSTTRWQYQSQV